MRARIIACRRPSHRSGPPFPPAAVQGLAFLAALRASGNADPSAVCHPASAWAGRCGPGGTRAQPAPEAGARPEPVGEPPTLEFGYEARGEDAGGFGGGPFGVRRPLRFLAVKLGLSEAQVKEMARILDELKTERAQSEVDRRRTLAAFADAVSGATFDDARAGEGADLRVRDAQRLRDAVLNALRRIHALLDAAQREQLAYMIRTGTLLL